MSDRARHVILLLASQPTDDGQLALTREFEQIDDALAKTQSGGHFHLEKRFEVESHRIPEFIMKYRPSIVHFSGHGNESGELTFSGPNGHRSSPTTELFAQIFEKFTDIVKCVVLNACYSETQAAQIARHVEAVIGMSGKFGDQAATEFSTAFYEALGYGGTIAEAFSLAKLRGPLLGEDNTGGPVLRLRPGQMPHRRFVSKAGRIVSTSEPVQDTSISSTTAINDFSRFYPLRRSQIMWFLGAGASAAAGVPTAAQMIWDFKRSLFCSQEKRSIATVSDLASEDIQRRIQSFIDSAGIHPPRDSDNEYAHFFEYTYPNERDRRVYIERKAAGAKPSYGHYALATLMGLRHCNMVWSTNFDTLVEDGYSSTQQAAGSLRVINANNTDLVQDSLSGEPRPTLIKLHGDFQSGALKTTRSELQAHDESLRRALTDSLRTHGLAVIGYSGRDESIMDTLLAAAQEPGTFSAGLYWFHRSGEPVAPSVTRLINSVREHGAEASLIEVDTFDELFGDLLVQFPDIPPEIHDKIESSRRRRRRLPLPDVAGDYPVLRLNAVRVLTWPMTCRLIECNVGGTREVRDAIATADVPVVAVRSRAGVLAFGSDADVRKAFSPFEISRFDMHNIDAERLRWDSAERGLLYEAICRALTQYLPLREVRRRGHRLFVADETREQSALAPILGATRALGGRIEHTSIMWREAIEIRLDYKLDRMWLIILPTVHALRSDDNTEEERRRVFVREQLANRYNSHTNGLIDAWSKVLVGGLASSKTFHLFDHTIVGANASFEIGHKTGFSWRQYGHQ